MGQVYPVLTQLAKYDSVVSETRLDRSNNVDFKGHLPFKVISPVEKTGGIRPVQFDDFSLGLCWEMPFSVPFPAFHYQ